MRIVRERRFLDGKGLWAAGFAVAVGSGLPAYGQGTTCLYQGVLLATSSEWCAQNGQASLSSSQIGNPSVYDGIKALQMLLSGAGYDPGPIDGAMGPRTATAIREFQRRFGLPVTGEVDPSLITKLTEQAQARTTAWRAVKANEEKSRGSESRPSAQEVATAARVGGRAVAEVAEHGAPALKAVGGLVLTGIVGLGYFLWNFLKKRRGS